MKIEKIIKRPQKIVENIILHEADKSSIKHEKLQELLIFLRPVGETVNNEITLKEHNKIKSVQEIFDTLKAEKWNLADIQVSKEQNKKKNKKQNEAEIKAKQAAITGKRTKLDNSYKNLLGLTNKAYEKALSIFLKIDKKNYELLDRKLNLNTIYSFVEFATKATVNAEEALSKCSNIINNTKEILDATEKNITARNEVQNNDIMANSKVDWDSLYDKAVEENKTVEFFKKYFSENGAWGKYGVYFQFLGEAFRQEVESLGFSGSNPFIYFLNQITILCENDLKNKSSIILNNISKLYASIHNAYATNKLSADDLRGKGVLGLNNLIFSPSFYGATSGTGKEYLELQAILIKNFVNSSGPKWSFPALADSFNGNVLSFFTKVFYETPETSSNIGDPTKLLTSTELNDKSQENLINIIRSNKLRNTRLIQQLLTRAFNNDSANKKVDKNDEDDTIEDSTDNTTNKLADIDLSSDDELKKFIKKLNPKTLEKLKNLLDEIS